MERKAGASKMGLSVRAVFFDLDNTLIDTARASRKGMLEVTSSTISPPPGGVSAPPSRTARSGFLVIFLSLCLLLTRGQVIPQGIPRHWPLVLSDSPILCYPEELKRRMTGLGRQPSIQPDGLGHLPIYAEALGSWIPEVGAKRFDTRKYVIKPATMAET